MIAAEPDARQTRTVPDWQRELAEAVRDPLDLLARLGLAPADLGPDVTAEALLAATRGFPLRVPQGFIARMRPRDPADPLLRQVLAVPAELHDVEGFGTDPLQETTAREAPGLLRKYAGRALLVSTGACAVHCRYCFRRHYDYGLDVDEGQPRWSAALAQLDADPDVDEVILSGGDPLSLGNARLGALLAKLAQLPRLRRLRIHTRTPVVLPSRVDPGLLALLAPWRARLVIVVHANHAAELDEDVVRALRALGGASTALLNQSVLLAGVNDDATVLAALSKRLFEAGVMPYYLHQLDKVAGAAHFLVENAQALQLHAALLALLPGYLVPRLVREDAGAPSKTPLLPG